jgi:tetratricopeptide (TPR) repeat protein
MDLKRLITDVEILKNEAKLARDANQVDEAIDLLTEAVGEIEESGWKPHPAGVDGLDEQDRTMAWHYADCLGMLGGNFRRKAQQTDASRRVQLLKQAIACFERGRTYEQEPNYRIASSYNTVNAIVAPIEGQLEIASSQTAELERAVAMLRLQVSDPKSATRRLDRWAWADLGQCQLLLGDEVGARTTYQRFIELSDLATIQSALKVLHSIGAALKAMHDDFTAQSVANGIQQLESQLPK